MSERWRQSFHLEPEAGLMNDPNGLCWYRGAYHVYFQYSPDSAFGLGRKCWGHFESPDLLDWRFDGIVLQPDCSADRDGVYSGSALVTEQGLRLFYTGNVKHPGPFDYITAGREGNVLTVLSPDGRAMGEKQLLLTNRDYPADTGCHVRDPKVFPDGGGFGMVLGARSLGDRGRVLLYHSADALHWELEKVLETAGPFGYMWECPDLFELEGRTILSVSPQGLPHGAERYQNVYQSGWFELHGPRADWLPEAFTEWDMGFDFYAPQTFLSPDGRRLLFGWMGLPDAPYGCPTAPLGWQHCLTVPRELFFDGEGRLCQRPARELLGLAGPGRFAWPAEQLPLRLCGRTEGSFALTLTPGLRAAYDAQEGLFTLTFAPDGPGAGRTERRVRLPRCRSLELLADASSLEFFLDGGAAVLSTRFWPDGRSLALRAEGFTPIVQPMRPLRCTNPEHRHIDFCDRICEKKGVENL